MATLRDLEQGTERLRKNGNDDVRKTALKLNRIKLDVEQQSLLFESEVRGSSTYTTQIEFYDVRINPADVLHRSITIPLNNTVEVKVSQPTQIKNRVTVNCSCADYTFTFAYSNHQKKAHYGVLPDYQRKTKTHAPRNPKQTGGLCKHLDLLVEFLLKEKYLG